MQSHESKKLSEVLGGLGESPTIIEAGVYAGEETKFILSALRHRHAAYYAFEADPRNIQRIRNNGYPAGVELIEAAIGREDGEIEMHLSQGGEVTGSSSIHKPTAHLTIFPHIKYPWTHRVRMRSLDSFAAERGIQRVDFLFTDIEGAERDLIEGGRKTLERTRWWYTEFWDGVRCPLPYEGMWSKDQILAALPGWEVEACFESDMLLRNTRCA